MLLFDLRSAAERTVPLWLAMLAAPAIASAQGMTLYGLVDLGLAIDKPLGERAFKSMNSGGKSGSRLGVRIAEDLGGGSKVLLVLEQGLQLDTGSRRDEGRMFDRQSFVAIENEYGVLALGRIPTFSAGSGEYDFVGEFDPFATSWGIAGVGSTHSSAAGLRTDQTILYRSPQAHGLIAGVAYAFQLDGEKARGTIDNPRVIATGLRYGSDTFSAAITYDIAKNPVGGSDEKHLQVFVGYDWQVVKMYGAFANERNQFVPGFNATATTNGANANAFMVGISAPIGRGAVRASYQARRGSDLGGDKRDVRLASLGYDYNMSKRTSLYVLYVNSKGGHTLSEDPTFSHQLFTGGVSHRF